MTRSDDATPISSWHGADSRNCGGDSGVRPRRAAQPTQVSKPAAVPATSAPAKPAEAPPTPVVSPPAEAAKPAAAAQPLHQRSRRAEARRQLIGKLEGPEILAEAKRPAKLGEAPMLAELVKAGKLPPVEQRVPEEPLVIKPLPRDRQVRRHLAARLHRPGRRRERQPRSWRTDKLIFWDYTGTKLVPAVAQGLGARRRRQDDHVLAAQGHKWSDGAPFTADDVMFWYEDIYLNKDLDADPARPRCRSTASPARSRRSTRPTVAFTFPEPYPLFVDMLGGSSFIGGVAGDAAATSCGGRSRRPTT